MKKQLSEIELIKVTGGKKRHGYSKFMNHLNDFKNGFLKVLG